LLSAWQLKFFNVVKAPNKSMSNAHHCASKEHAEDGPTYYNLELTYSRKMFIKLTNEWRDNISLSFRPEPTLEDRLLGLLVY
jgi:hypothetical protein